MLNIIFYYKMLLFYNKQTNKKKFMSWFSIQFNLGTYYDINKEIIFKGIFKTINDHN
jgi:hypothetical protein